MGWDAHRGAWYVNRLPGYKKAISREKIEVFLSTCAQEYVKCLEDRVQLLEQQNLTLIQEIKKLKGLSQDPSLPTPVTSTPVLGPPPT